MPVHAHETSRAGAAETLRKVEGESRRHDGVSQKEAEGGDRAEGGELIRRRGKQPRWVLRGRRH